LKDQVLLPLLRGDVDAHVASRGEGWLGWGKKGRKERRGGEGRDKAGEVGCLTGGMVQYNAACKSTGFECGRQRVIGGYRDYGSPS